MRCIEGLERVALSKTTERSGGLVTTDNSAKDVKDFVTKNYELFYFVRRIAVEVTCLCAVGYICAHPRSARSAHMAL